MSSRELKNKPLIEAILEVKWAMQSPAPGVQIDPHYKILLGRLYDRVCDEYPEHEQLPIATIPDEIVGQTVQHRFRYAPNDWPLIQVGPGILTVNETQKYTWNDFRSRTIIAVRKLFDAHPKLSDLKVESLLLRYIDAVDFDYNAENIFGFLREKMKVLVSLPDSLFANTGIQDLPKHFNWLSAFDCTSPKGIVSVRFATGQREGDPCLLWETMVQSAGSDAPMMPEGFENWIDAAHNITHDWFFKLIEGELERGFNGE